jgi:hypothetical protein
MALELALNLIEWETGGKDGVKDSGWNSWTGPMFHAHAQG